MNQAKQVNQGWELNSPHPWHSLFKVDSTPKIGIISSVENPTWHDVLSQPQLLLKHQCNWKQCIMMTRILMTTDMFAPLSPSLTISITRPRAGLRPAGPRWIVGRLQFSCVHLSRLASRLRRSARRGHIVLQKTFKRWWTCPWWLKSIKKVILIIWTNPSLKI